MTFPRLISVNEWKQLSRNTKKISLNDETEENLRKVYRNVNIHDRLDALIALYELCKDKSGSPYVDFFNSVKKIIAHLLDISIKQIKPPDTLDSIIADRIIRRKVVREYDPSYMPWSRPKISNVHDGSHPLENDPYEVLIKSNDKKAAFESFKKQMDKCTLSLIQNVDYREIEKEDYRVIPHEGQLIKFTLKGSGDDQHLSFQSFHTRNLTIKSYDDFLKKEHDIPETGIYVFNIDGSMFVGPSIHTQRLGYWEKLNQREPIIHPSYSNRPFIAGQIQGDRFVSMIDPGSGHFQPEKERYQLAVDFFKEKKIVNNHTQLTLYEQDAYTVNKCNENQAHILRFIKENDIQYKTENDLLCILKERRPDLAMQHEIENADMAWRNASNISLSRQSEAKLNIDSAMEYFSKYANARNPDKSLYYLDQVFDSISDWRHFHETKSSMRLNAVNDLEKKLLSYQFYFLLHKYFQESQLSLPMIKQFLSHEINLDKFIETLLESRYQPTLFDNLSIADSVLSPVLTLIGPKQSIDDFKKINNQLKDMIHNISKQSQLLFE